MAGRRRRRHRQPGRDTGLDGEAEPAQESVTADLDGLLSDEQIDQLFSELVIGEAVAETSEAEPDAELEQVLNDMEDRGYLDPPPPAAAVDEDAEAYKMTNSRPSWRR